MAVGANLLLVLIFAPYLQKTTGIGTRISATQPRSVLAQLTPSASNMYVAKRGNTAPKRDRRKVFAAIAEAALQGGMISWGIEMGTVGQGQVAYNMRYESTR